MNAHLKKSQEGGAGVIESQKATLKPAAQIQVEVFPTGSYPQDVAEVRAAVNGGTGPSGKSYPGGGIVKLRAVTELGTRMYFNFGNPLDDQDTVEVTRDVTIVGEKTTPVTMALPNNETLDKDLKPDRAVIFGGKRPFGCSRAAQAKTSLTIRDLYFAYPALAAIQVHKSAGLEVTDCVIHDVLRAEASKPGFFVAVGIEATTMGAPAPADLSGKFRVVNNRIKRGGGAPAGSVMADTGIVLQQASMTAEISGNDIELFEFTGIGIDRNDGPVNVMKNKIRTCGYGQNKMAAGIGVRGTTTPVVIEGNDIKCGHPKAIAAYRGITVASSNVLVKANTIGQHCTHVGIWLTKYQPTGMPPFYASNNTIDRNQLIGLTADTAQVAIDENCASNSFVSNDYGNVDVNSGTAEAGVLVASNANEFANDHFADSYPGKSAVPSVPCLWFKPGTSGNHVSAFTFGNKKPGTILCDQVKDEGTNTVDGYENC